MPGSPRKRAARLAEQSRHDEVSGDWMLKAPAGLAEHREIVAAREMNDTWWRKQVAELDRAASDRKLAMRNGDEAVHASQARVFGALGVPPDVAAALMGVTEGQFQGQYAEDYAVGSATIVARVSANFLRIATEGEDRYAVKAAAQILQSRGGEPWRPPAQKIEVERTAPKSNLIDSSKLTAEERQALRAIIMAATAREQMAAIEGRG